MILHFLNLYIRALSFWMLKCMNVSASIQRENLCTICHLFDAEYVCNKCEDEQFCSKCYEKEHAVSPLLQRHQRLAVSINPALMTLCPSHPNEKLRYCCGECNNVFICRECTFFNHKDHKHILMEEVVKGLQTKVSFISYKYIIYYFVSLFRSTFVFNLFNHLSNIESIKLTN
jgi:hypothetical protein